jgi:DNA-binding XRE family transcriptional regulator
MTHTLPDAYYPAQRDINPGMPPYRVRHVRTPTELVSLRAYARLTQRQLADLLGVSESTVARLERTTSSSMEIDARWTSHLTLLFAHILKDKAAQ